VDLVDAVCARFGAGAGATAERTGLITRSFTLSSTAVAASSPLSSTFATWSFFFRSA
jgi:hypothetical protein